MKMMEEKSTRGSSASELDEESSFHDNSARDRSSSGSTHKEGGTREDEEQLAAKETAAVFRLRVIVLVILFLAAVAVSLGVWFITTSSEKEDFETNFDGASAKLVESFEEIADQKIGALASLSSTLTSFARNENDTWPFVVMNDFQQRAATARGLSDSLFLELLPIVNEEARGQWEEFSVKNKGWLDDGRTYQKRLGYDQLWKDTEEGSERRVTEDNADGSFVGENVIEFVAGDGQGSSYIANQIWRFDANYQPIRDVGPGPYYPIWQSSPILASPRDLVNWNIMDYAGYAPYTVLSGETGHVAIGGIDVSPTGDITSDILATSFFAFILSYAAGRNVDYKGDPFSSVYIPVYDSYEDDKTTVGVLLGVMRWATYFEGVLPPTSEAVTVVLESSLEGAFTYRVTPENAEYVGPGDLHETKYSHMAKTANFRDRSIRSSGTFAFTLDQSLNAHRISVYPTKEFEDAFKSKLPLVTTMAVGFVFVFTAIMFLVYDRLVERRQKLVLKTAERSNAIVTSLFPSQVRDRLMENVEARTAVTGTTTKIRSFLHGNNLSNKSEDADMDDFMYKDEPIADFFAESTVMFGDVQGFTAWSSTREPSDVFRLLETLYKAFDEIAAKRRVFKVETVGDCYVAVCGVPDHRRDHPVVMARFAADCLRRMNTLTKKLEKILGPDTGDLRMRIGLHSGPVTGGVLRGERSRFQLFGDTMNTAARMESTGDGNKIHVSKETADLIAAAGKGSWLSERDDVVVAKGKGALKTFWLGIEVARDDNKSDAGSSDCNQSNETGRQAHDTENPHHIVDDKTRRLIEWNVDVLKRLLKEVLAWREGSGRAVKSSFIPNEERLERGHTVIDEVSEIISLPKLHRASAAKKQDVDSVRLDEAVESQLEALVSSIAALYRQNPFHSFEHASHVTMSVVKLLRRIVAPSELDFENADQALSQLHDHTYGITSDPLTQFACVFSALIHDVDHQGVTNTQLIKENSQLADYYKNKSVAEQNSVDLCWSLLMDDAFADLRACIYTNAAEYKRFRQLVVNSVMATDIMDKDLKKARNDRWERAFSERASHENVDRVKDRKATIVIEHLIQASDVSHTMQHWHIYRKWNERLFEELHRAYQQGRADADPATFWAKGEIGFFDFYIIPLAKKLKECGVFGVSSDEYLNYALANRNEWEVKGPQIVAEMVERLKAKGGSNGNPTPSSA